MPQLDLLEPQFNQPEVLAVANLSAATLQTWVNRSLLQMYEQNPGTGKRRKYRALDVARLAIMQRLTAFGVTASKAKDMAEEATAGLAAQRPLTGREVFVVSPPIEGLVNVEIISSNRKPYRLDDFHYTVITGDPKAITLERLAGGDRSIGLAIGADAVLVVRVGQIINNVLTRLTIILETAG